MARPLQKTYSPDHPYTVERHDQDDGSINYEIWDNRPDNYRRLCTVHEDYSVSRGQAKRDAELIARSLNARHGLLTPAERNQESKRQSRGRSEED